MTTSRRDFVKLLSAASVPISLAVSGPTVAARALQSGGTSNVAKHFVNQTVTTLSPVGTGSSPALPTGSPPPFMAAGTYSFNGQLYDCSKQGLYRFWKGDASPIESRIVGSNADPYPLLSAMSWHHLHGREDEGFFLTSPPQLAQAAAAGLQHKWRLFCGYIADLAIWALTQPQFAFTTRHIQLRTTQPLNNINDGHIVIEVYFGGKWRLWDLTNGCYFIKSGIHLSADEIITAGVLNCVRVPIDDDAKYSASIADLGGGVPFCIASYRDIQWHTRDEEDAWFARIYGTWSAF